jgi:hypothetical protein
MGFPDPAKATGTEEEILNEFRKVRDNIRLQMVSFLRQEFLAENQTRCLGLFQQFAAFSYQCNQRALGAKIFAIPF